MAHNPDGTAVNTAVLEDATPKPEKTGIYNPDIQEGGERLKTLMPSALPAAVRRQGVPQQPLAFLLL